MNYVSKYQYKIHKLIINHQSLTMSKKQKKKEQSKTGRFIVFSDKENLNNGCALYEGVIHDTIYAWKFDTLKSIYSDNKYPIAQHLIKNPEFKYMYECELGSTTELDEKTLDTPLHKNVSQNMKGHCASHIIANKYYMHHTVSHTALTIKNVILQEKIDLWANAGIITQVLNIDPTLPIVKTIGHKNLSIHQWRIISKKNPSILNHMSIKDIPDIVRSDPVCCRSYCEQFSGYYAMFDLTCKDIQMVLANIDGVLALRGRVGSYSYGTGAYITDPCDDDVVITAIKQNPKSIEFVKNITRHVAEYIIENNPGFYKWVKHKMDPQDNRYIIDTLKEYIKNHYTDKSKRFKINVFDKKIIDTVFEELIDEGFTAFVNYDEFKPNVSEKMMYMIEISRKREVDKFRMANREVEKNETNGGGGPKAKTKTKTKAKTKDENCIIS